MRKLLIFVFTIIVMAAFSVDYSFIINGKSYKIVKTQKTWVDAATWAIQDGGYLVHINSQLEQDSIWAAIQASGISTTYTTVNDGGGIAYIWIGATDKNTEGTWLWDGDNDGAGDHFYTGQGQNGVGNGAVVNNAFVKWGGITTSGSATSNEPDDYFANQDAAAIALDGWPGGSGALGLASEWNDIAATNSLYFIVEYESVGMLEIDGDFELLIQTEKSYSKAYSSDIVNTFFVFDITGKKVVELTPFSSTFEIVGLKSGIFFYLLQSKDGVVRRGKFLVY